MFFSSISAPIFVEISENLLQRVDEVITKNNIHFDRALIITDEFCAEHFLPSISINALVRQIEDVSWVDLKDEVVESQIDLIIGLGGGRVIDIAKLVSYEAKKILVVIPTLLSSDSISSPVSVVWKGSKYEKLGSAVPSGIVVDLDLVSKSPPKYTLAGTGDLLAKFSSTYDLSLGIEKLNLRFNFLAVNLCRMSARFFLAEHKADKEISKGFCEDLAYGLVLTGLAMEWAGTTYPASGSEHNLAHAVDMLYPNRDRIHGITVGFFTLFTLYLQQQRKSYFDLLQFYRNIGFPLSLDEINVKPEQMVEVLRIAPNIRKRYTVLNLYSIEDLIQRFNVWLSDYEGCWRNI